MLETVEKIMKEYISDLKEDRVDSLFEKIPKGKRLRAKLILKIADQNEDTAKLAAIIELIHAASLLHDDVIDDAKTRRGLSSINAIFGDKTAIMIGDILYSKAFFELVSFDKEIAKTVSNSVSLLSAGELLDVELAKDFTPDKEKYLDMIYKKTASLIEASARSAALLCKKDDKAFAAYGKNLGLAFQIIDDILDITQSSEKLGKPALNDFKEGKTTLPYIYLYESLENDDKKRLKSLYKKELKNDDAKWIKEQMEKSGALQRSVLEAVDLGKQALKSIENEKNTDLENIIKDMIDREF